MAKHLSISRTANHTLINTLSTLTLFYNKLYCSHIRITLNSYTSVRPLDCVIPLLFQGKDIH